MLRAKNVYTALKDILGKELKVPEDRIFAQGLGERAATDAGDKDEAANPNYRKVEMILNSRLTLTLKGE